MTFKYSISIILSTLLLTLLSCANPNPFIEGQKWEGKYICHLDEYDLALEIIAVQNNVVKAVVTENIKVYSGNFIVMGEYDDESSQIEFKAIDWVPDQKDRFRNAEMVDFNAFILRDPPRLEGEIISDYEECFGFKVKLVE